RAVFQRQRLRSVPAEQPVGAGRQHHGHGPPGSAQQRQRPVVRARALHAGSYVRRRVDAPRRAGPRAGRRRCESADRQRDDLVLPRLCCGRDVRAVQRRGGHVRRRVLVRHAGGQRSADAPARGGAAAGSGRGGRPAGHGHADRQVRQPGAAPAGVDRRRAGAGWRRHAQHWAQHPKVCVPKAPGEGRRRRPRGGGGGCRAAAVAVKAQRGCVLLVR
ncbi:hypothetical protein H4R21_006498, partial [Coemansia helicoidea]